MGSTKFKSIRSELRFFNKIIIILTFFGLLLLVSFNFITYSTYNNFSNNYEDLAEFYRCVEDFDINASNYLYSSDEQYLNDYNESYLRATEIITTRHETSSDKSDKFEYSKILNMMTTYDETFETLNITTDLNNSEYSADYGFMTRIAANIDDTSTFFYSLITDRMVEEKSAIQINAIFLAVIMSVIILALAVLNFHFYKNTIKHITKPIGKIINNINKIKIGVYDLKEIKNAGQEFEVLAEAFDEMASTVQKYITGMSEKANLELELLEKDNENLRINKLLTESELRILQEQINPHFIFNTLSMLSKMAYFENAKETSMLMESVSDLLRYGLENAAKASNLEGEIMCLNNYMTIQEKRFGHRIDFNLKIQQPIYNVMMPGMLLQPIVENAIMHGLKNVTKGGEIDVTIIDDENNVYIMVEDNGEGMGEDKIASILEHGVDEENGRIKIGTNNVINRMKIFYGSKSSFKIDSSVDCGTVISITIPKII